MPDPVVIATWPFGKLAAEAAIARLTKGDPALDAALAGAQAVEDDPSVHSVGFGSLPDRIGRLTLDACVMDGATLSCGAVAGVEHIRHPAALARRVMEKTPHVLLVGEAVKWFALQQGFPLEMPYTVEAVKEWLEKHPDRKKKGEPGSQAPGASGTAAVRYDDPAQIHVDELNHDTVTVLTRDAKGHLGGVCTTSGLAYKLPGRVGDSPIIGAGLYVDDQAGAAGGTGVGEEIIRIGGSFFVVEQMRAGKSPQEACELACKRINATAVRRGVHPAAAAFVALDPKGNVGAACTSRTNFRYAVGRGEKTELLQAKEVPPEA